jgi:hypothetical protein
MVQETWTSRDLPVLEAIAELYDEGQSDRVDVTAVGHRTGLDKEAVQHAIRNLKNAGYITGATRVGAGAKYGFVGALAPEGLRVVGAWPTPENLLKRLVEGLERASQDENRPEEERSKLRQAATWFGGFASQVAIGALGGAGGDMLGGL